MAEEEGDNEVSATTVEIPADERTLELLGEEPTKEEEYTL
jgi:hypothetical protein